MAIIGWAVWHVTPAGWSRGSDKAESGEDDALVPPDAVASVEYLQLNNDLTLTRHVFRPGHDPEQLTQLLATFGEPPPYL